MVDSFLVPDSFLIKHEDFSSGLDSEDHVKINDASHRSFEDQISGILGRIDFWIDGFKIWSTDSWGSDGSSSGDFLVDDLFCLWEQLHFNDECVGGFPEWAL